MVISAYSAYQKSAKNIELIGRMCDGSFTKLATASLRSVYGSFATSKTFTPSNQSYERSERVPPSENGIRPTKLGAENWLFMGSESAGQTSAIWYTLIESCRRRRIDPWRYLVWIFEELPKEKVKKDSFASYTPEAYSKRQVELESKHDYKIDHSTVNWRLVGRLHWADKHSRFTLIFEAFAIAVLEAARSLGAGRRLLGLS